MNLRPILVVSLLGGLLVAQTGSISGTVTDLASGEPLIGANVILSDTDFTTGTAADVEGRYLLENLPPGDYTLKVTYIGYRTYTSPAHLEAGPPGLTHDIQLTVSAIQLQEYVVTASRGRREKITDAPAAMSIISELKIRSASNPNLGDYFKNIKGVDFTASGLDSYNLSARGFNSSFSSRLLTLTDGRKANVPSLRLIAYNTIPITSDDVRQIEVVLGPSSALYGPDAHSGVVNIITKRPTESLGTVTSYSAGSRDFRKWQVRHAGQNGNLGYKLSFVDFSAYDWVYVEEAEKKAHLRPWIDNQGAYGEVLDDMLEADSARWDGYNILIDKNGDGQFTYGPEDSVVWGLYQYSDNPQNKKNNLIADINNDGQPDTADFHIQNQRLDLRFDYRFSRNHFLSTNFGQALASNINITGIGRYLARNWLYRYYQLRYVYHNWYAQIYLNTSDSGTTRNLRTGAMVVDNSKFFHFQFQHSLDLKRFRDTKLIWGMDYQRTMPETYGTILPDGTGGRNPESYGRDGEDNDGDGEVDEIDELIVTNEYGLYAQSQTRLTDQFELILAGRLDLHSGQTDDQNGIPFLDDPLAGGTVKYFPQWSPKIGLLWKPRENQTFRLTAARAFNTPSSQGLYLDILVGLVPPFPVYARGNVNGYHYTRNQDQELMMYDVRAGSRYEFRLAKMPDSAVLYIPPVLDRPALWVEPEDYASIDPVRSEVVWTYELGYSGFIGQRIRASFDLYHSTYSDFVSDLTWVTPVVLDTSQGLDDAQVLGFIATSEHDGIIDGGDGIPGSRWIDYDLTPTSEWMEMWNNTGDAFWNLPPEARRGSWIIKDETGKTQGAYYTDDQTDFVDPIALMLTNINYGRVSLWGFDASLYAFLTESVTADINFSFLGRRSFYNFLTRGEDPINAPQFKLTATLAYNPPRGMNGNISFRYIPEFDWSAGVHYGTIESYFLIDLSLGYQLNEMYSLLLNVTNLFDDYHREIVGGPKIGRHLRFKITAHL